MPVRKFYTRWKPELLTEIEQILINKLAKSVTKATDLLGLNYQTYLNNTTREQRKLLQDLTTTNRREAAQAIIETRECTDLVPFIVDPLLEQYSVTKSGLVPQQSLNDFPPIIYKCWTEPLINKVVSVPCRLFYRIEMAGGQLYHVAGYEYLSHPGQYTADQFLHIYNTASSDNVLTDLKVLLAKRINQGVEEPELGIVSYGLTAPEHKDGTIPPTSKPIIVHAPEGKRLIAKTPVKVVPDGKYDCTIAGQNGKLLYKGEEHWFVLGEMVGRQNRVPCRVLNGIVTVYL